MARYLVGADDDKPSLIDAVRNASDGDIIELEEGYCPNVNYITLSKSLSFIGHVVKTEEAKRGFSKHDNQPLFYRERSVCFF